MKEPTRLKEKCLAVISFETFVRAVRRGLTNERKKIVVCPQTVLTQIEIARRYIIVHIFKNFSETEQGPEYAMRCEELREESILEKNTLITANN